MPVAIHTPTPATGLKAYYQAKIEAAELEINQKTQNLRRLEAQRNALNARGAYAVYNIQWRNTDVKFSETATRRATTVA